MERGNTSCIFLVPEKSTPTPSTIKELSSVNTLKKNVLRVRGSDQLCSTPEKSIPRKHQNSLSKTMFGNPTSITKPFHQPESVPFEKNVNGAESGLEPAGHTGLPTVRRLKRGLPDTNSVPAKRSKAQTSNKIMVGVEAGIDNSKGIFMPESLLKCLVNVKEVIKGDGGDVLCLCFRLWFGILEFWVYS